MAFNDYFIVKTVLTYILATHINTVLTKSQISHVQKLF